MLSEYFCTKMEGDPNDHLHELIKKNDAHGVNKWLTGYLSTNFYDRHLMNSNNESAVLTALESWNIEIYDLLLGRNLRLNPFEEVPHINTMSLERKEELREVRKKHLQNPNIKHLDILIRKSRTSHDNILEENMKRFHLKCISQVFEELNELKSIVPIMKVVSLSRLTIVFDLNRDSTEVLAPRTSKKSQGITLFHEGYIYVSAKDAWKDERRHITRGVLAHELCHFAMQLLYNNDCQPYYEDELDDDNVEIKKKFEDTLNECEKNKEYEELIEVVFNDYEKNEWHAELIARVPHLIAFYKGNDDKTCDMEITFAPLFNFYERVLKRIEEKYPLMESRNEVKKLNEKFGLFQRLNGRIPKTKFRPNFLNCLQNNGNQAYVLKSNISELTMEAIFQEILEKKESDDSHHLLVPLTFLRHPETRTKVKDLLENCTQLCLVIDCSELSSAEDVSELECFFRDAANQRIVFVCQSDGTKNENITHKWSHLTDETQNRLFKREIEFQGRQIPLEKLLPLVSEALDCIPLKELIKNELKVGKSIDEVEEFTLDRYFRSEEYHKEPIFTAEKIIKQAEQSRIIVLSNDPGMGKSTECKLMVKRIKEKQPANWVIFMGLQQFTKFFDKDVKKTFQSQEEITKYFCSKILNLSVFDGKVFHQLFKDGRVVFLMDGFDEISPSFKDFNLTLMQAIIEKSKNQIWISTRPHLEGDLRRKFEKAVVFHLSSFNKGDRDRFLRKRLEAKGISGDYLEVAMKKIESLSYSLGDLFNPLLLRMITDVFEDKEMLNKNSIHLNIFTLYDTFKVKAMSTLLKEKGPEADREHLEQLAGPNPTEILKHLQKLALDTIYNGQRGGQSVTLYFRAFRNLPELSDQEKTRISLVTSEQSTNKIEFVHRTFAEFFVAEYIFNMIFSLHEIDEIGLQDTKLMFKHIWTGDYNKDNKMVTEFVNHAISQKLDSLLSNNSEVTLMKQKFEKLLDDLGEDLGSIEDTKKWIKVQMLCLFFLEKKKSFYKLIFTVKFNTVFSKKWEILGHFAEFCSPTEFDEIISFAIEYRDQKQVNEFLHIESLCTRDILSRAMHNIEHMDMFDHILHNQQIQGILKDEGWKRIFSCDDEGGKDFLLIVANTRQFLIFLKWLNEKLGRNGVIKFLENSGGLNHVGYLVNFSGYEKAKECCQWLKNNLSRSEFNEYIIRPSLSETKFGIQYNVRVTHFEEFFKTDEEKKLFLLKENNNGWTAFHFEFSSWVQKNSFGLVINTYERWCGKDEMKKLLMKKVTYSHEMSILHLAVINKCSEYCNLKLLWTYITKLLDKESLKMLMVDKNDKDETFFRALKNKLLLISTDWPCERKAAFVEETLRFHEPFIRNNYEKCEIDEFDFNIDSGLKYLDVKTIATNNY